MPLALAVLFKLVLLKFWSLERRVNSWIGFAWHITEMALSFGRSDFVVSPCEFRFH